MPSASPPRRSQRQRREDTQAKLLEAAIDCIAQVGYQASTLTVIAERAGLSRGGRLHHYPTKAELVVRALEHLIDQQMSAFEHGFRSLDPTTDRVASAIDMIWAQLNSKSFAALLELVVVARTDDELRRNLTRLTTKFHERVAELWVELFEPRAGHKAFFEIAPTFGFALFQGLALQRIAGADVRMHGRVLDAWKAIESAAVQARREVPQTLTKKKGRKVRRAGA
jgi:AcrR family transcriptional regulator